MSEKPEAPVTGLALLRAPFPDNAISKLPKETKKQAADRKAAMERGDWPPRCKVCDGFHHVGAVHLDYVGHAALTDRLLDADPKWNWRPMAFGSDGLPTLDRNGGMWIYLTVAGVERIGYGSADGKTGGDAIKEIIGDALRNSGMRFGAALDLWHKGDLHADDQGEPSGEPKIKPQGAAATKCIKTLSEAKTAEQFKATWEASKASWKEFLSAEDYAHVVAAMKSQAIVWQSHKAEPEAAETPFDDEDRVPF